MAKNAVILFAHGAKSKEWEKPIRALAESLSIELAPATVTLAFLQFGDPKLPEVIDGLAGRDFNRIIILPYFLAAGGHLLRDLPEILAAAQKKYPGIEFHSARPLGEYPEAIAGLKQASINFVESALLDSLD